MGVVDRVPDRVSGVIQHQTCLTLDGEKRHYLTGHSRIDEGNRFSRSSSTTGVTVGVIEFETNEK